ncbi:MAG: ATP-binding cassette domain-containing protein [Treponema sp.]|jgi:simple sugar transport system ATP-binding protein|nr:ATP-binding cassette domain-containing protein [Treponema sp.]
MVELRQIHKYFSINGVKALEGANFNLQDGEIHALLGENGAGKSTLMHIMAGFMKPEGENMLMSRSNAGTILVHGREHVFSSPVHAFSAGIGMVRQHPRHIPGFMVWESCIVGSEKHPSLWFNRHSFRKQIADLNEHFKLQLPLDSPVEFLSVSQGQKAAILSLLLRNTRYVIFDEPTAVLSPEEAENLFKILFALRNAGKGIVLITHKLDEALRIADRLTVLRQGITQICCKPDMLSRDDLNELIFGKESTNPVAERTGYGCFGKESVSGYIPTNFSSCSFEDMPQRGRVCTLRRQSKINPVKFPAAAKPCRTTKEKDYLQNINHVLVLQNFSVNVPGFPLIQGINLKLEQGKILGISGVRGSGLETLELAITGFLPFMGTMQIGGKKINGNEPSTPKRIRAFRKASGVFLGTRNEGKSLPIRDMLLIHAHRYLQNKSILDHSGITRWIVSVMEAAKVPLADKAAGDAFSGGQLQRLLLAREMAEHGKLLVLSEPGRNLDRQYRERLATMLREKAAEKTAVLVFSSDPEELLPLTDSIMVL